MTHKIFILALPGVDMATENTVNIGINVSDNGSTGKVTKDAKELKGVLDQAVAAAAKMGKGGAATLGSITQATGGANAATTYGVQRGVAGTTGAGARDFAKESEGIGGLVRVYATFAANIYAVSAAFNALSTAMDTANMVKGLDQLGAASGRSLGSLAKSLVAVTGGAISMREGMGSVATSSAAGLTSEQILKMGTVATKASQALGVNLVDAFSRISRGVTKLEPELLDELGLFTKLGPATEDYARSVGKSVGQLTDFEKRQAYANAVLKEGIDKFGKINIDVNPFVKLSASFQNLAQSGLEIVNKVIGPLVGLLASSPTALTLVIAGLGSMLLKQAIPAIGQFKERLKEAAEGALVNVATKSTPYRQGLAVNQAAITAQAEAEAEKWVSARDAATDKFNALSKSKLGQMPTVSRALEKGIYQVSEEDLKMLDARAARSLSTNKALSASYTELANTIRAGIGAETAYQAEKAKGMALSLEAAETSKKQMLADVEFRELGIKAVQREMAAKASATVKELGFITALKEAWMQYNLIHKQGSIINVPVPGQFIEGPGGEKIQKRQDVKVDPIGRTAGLMGVLGAGASAAATGIGAVVSKLGVWGMAAMAAYTVGELLVSALSATNKESAATASALEKLSETTKTATDTMKELSSKNPFDQLTVESINARTTAFGELASSITNTIKTANEEMLKMNWIDKTIDFFKSGVNKDLQSKTGKEFVAGLQQSFKTAIPSKETDLARSTIEGILGTSIGDTEALEKAFKELGGSASSQIKAIVTNMETLVKKQQISSASAVELKENWKESGKALTAFISSSLPSDALSKLAQDMMADASKLEKSLKDPIQSLALMKTIANDVSILKLFPAADAARLSNYANELNLLSAEFAIAYTNITNTDDALDKLYATKLQKETTLNSVVPGSTSALTISISAKLRKELGELEEEIERVKKLSQEGVIPVLQARQADIQKVFGDAVRNQFIAGARILDSKIALEFAKSSTIVSNTLAGLLGDSIVAIEIKAKNDKLMVEAQVATIRSQINLLIGLEKLTTSIDLKRIQEDLGYMKAKEDNQGLDAKDKETQKNLTARSLVLEKRSTDLSGSPEKVLKDLGTSDALLKRLSAESKTGEGSSGVTRADINFSQTLAASIAALKTAGATLQNIDIDAEAKKLKYAYDLRVKVVDEAKTLNQVDLDNITSLEAQGKVLSDVQIARKTELEYTNLQFEVEKQIISILGQIEVKKFIQSKLEGRDADTQKAKLQVEIDRLFNVDITNVSLGVQGKVLLANSATEKKLVETAKTRRDYVAETTRILSESKLTNRSGELEIASILLESQKAMDTLTEDEYTNRKKLIDIGNLQLNQDKAESALRTKYEANLQNERDAQVLASSEGATLSEARIVALGTEFDIELANIQKIRAARQVDIEERSKYSDRQNAYADVFKKSFEGMADAIVEFARTGKLSFKDLVNTMIADLVRWELREQASSLYKLVRPGLMDFIGSMASSIFGGTVNPKVGAVTGPGGNASGISMQGATGLAFENGIKKFAMGGTFANSIVSSPTLFKFASGTGLMGEAGPEAIMPLKRDKQGNLGVRSGNNGGSVEVVVNNYGSEKATTKESTDSRGNRKVEVIIGDLSAGEISRNGSNSQRSLKNTFGLQPALIRR